MAKFKFKLDPVIKVRRIQMEQQAKEVALANKRVEAVKHQIGVLELDLKGEVERVQAAAQAENFSEMMMDLSSRRQDSLRKQIGLSHRQLSQAMEKALEEKQKLIEKETKKSALEKLRDRAEKNYKEEIRKQEGSQIDEAASVLFIRRRT